MIRVWRYYSNQLIKQNYTVDKDVFFFQAEYGIRDGTVTGVQTCALPIYLRAKFAGTPQMLINYLTLVAGEVRERLAQLGVKRLDELIGRADLLQCDAETSIDLAPLLVASPGTGGTVGEVSTNPTHVGGGGMAG